MQSDRIWKKMLITFGGPNKSSGQNSYSWSIIYIQISGSLTILLIVFDPNEEADYHGVTRPRTKYVFWSILGRKIIFAYITLDPTKYKEEGDFVEFWNIKFCLE